MKFSCELSFSVLVFPLEYFAVYGTIIKVFYIKAWIGVLPAICYKPGKVLVCHNHTSSIRNKYSPS